MNKLFNIIGFQASWWGCVLGVQAGMTYLGPFLMFSFLAVHIIRILDNYSELKLIILFFVHKINLFILNLAIEVSNRIWC